MTEELHELLKELLYAIEPDKETIKETDRRLKLLDFFKDNRHQSAQTLGRIVKDLLKDD